MIYYDIIISDKTKDKTDLYLMIKDSHIDEYEFRKCEALHIDKPIKLVTTNPVNPFRELDYAGVGCPEIVSEDFKNIVEDLGCESVIFVPTEVINFEVKKKYYVMNFTKTIQCIDEKRSKFFDLPIGENNSMVRSYAVPFIKQDINIEEHIFKATECPEFLFVSEIFKKEFEKRKLFGCDFYKR